MIISNEELQRLVSLFDKVDMEIDRWDFPLTDFDNRVIFIDTNLYPAISKFKDVVTVQYRYKDIKSLLLNYKHFCFEEELKYIFIELNRVIEIRKNDYKRGYASKQLIEFIYKSLLVRTLPDEHDYLTNKKYFIEIVLVDFNKDVPF